MREQGEKLQLHAVSTPAVTLGLFVQNFFENALQEGVLFFWRGSERISIENVAHFRRDLIAR